MQTMNQIVDWMRRRPVAATNVAWCAVLAVGGAGWIGWQSGGRDRAVDGEPRIPGTEGPAVAVNRLQGPLAGGASPGGAMPAGSRDDRGAAGGDVGRLSERLRAVLGLGDPLARAHEVTGLLAGLRADNIDEVREALESGPRSPLDDMIFQQFLSAWARIDGRAALDYVLQEGEGRKVWNGAGAAMESWARVDPLGAKAYLGEMEPGERRQDLHHNVVSALADTDLAAASAYAMENDRSRARGRSIDLLVDRHFDSGGIEGVRRWLDGIDSSGANDPASFRSYALMQATRRIAGQEPEQLESWVRENLGSAGMDGRTLYVAAEGIGKDDRGRSAEWLMELPTDAPRSGALEGIMGRWAREDPSGASEWLSSRELGGDYDPAVRALAQQVANDDPSAAMAWSSVITDDSMKAEVMGRVVRDWVRRDKVAAAEWVATNAESVPDRVLKEVSRWVN